MYIVDFFKNLVRKNNIGLIIWMVLNLAFIILMFSNGTWEGALLGFAVYAISMVIALSPIGEWILRMQNGCKEVSDPVDKERFEPLFREVYNKAKQMNPELPDDIRLFISDNADPNAFATGRKTVCVTKGLAIYSDEQIKGVLAHEFGHLAHKDTDAILVVAVGNMVVSAIFVIIRVIANISMAIGEFCTAVFSEGWGGVLASIMIRISRVIADFMLVLVMRAWTQLGVWLCMHSSRRNEYEADEYAYKCGYAPYLCQVLESFGTEKSTNGLFAALASSHPENADRISRLQALE